MNATQFLVNMMNLMGESDALSVYGEEFTAAEIGDALVQVEEQREANNLHV